MNAKDVSLDEWCRYWGNWADKQNAAQAEEQQPADAGTDMNNGGSVK